MSKKLLCFCLCFVLVLSGCIYGSSGEQTGMLAVYRVEQNRGGRSLIREEVSCGVGEDPLAAVSTALGRDGREASVESAFPEDVFVQNISLEAGKATVHMSPAYGELDRWETLLAESAIVLSLSAIDEVCTVDIYCGGKPAAADLRAESISAADGLCGGYERSVKLYLPDDAKLSLVPKSVTVYEDGSMCAAKRVMTALLERLGMENTEINEVSHTDGVCHIDFSHEFYGAEPTDSYTGMLMIYSVVNSLCRVPGVESVSLSVDGYTVESYGGFRTVWPLSENLNLIAY